MIEWRVDKLNRKAGKQYVSPADFADSYADLGRKEETIRYLRRVIWNGRLIWCFLQSGPGFDFLHSDLRYRAIIKKMRLPPAH